MKQSHGTGDGHGTAPRGLLPSWALQGMRRWTGGWERGLAFLVLAWQPQACSRAQGSLDEGAVLLHLGHQWHITSPSRGVPHLAGKKTDGIEEINPLAPPSVPLLDLDLCSSDKPAVWGPKLSEPGPGHWTRAEALTLAWPERKGCAVEESHLASIPGMQLLLCPPLRSWRWGLHGDSCVCTVPSLSPVNPDFQINRERETQGSQKATLLQ